MISMTDGRGAGGGPRVGMLALLVAALLGGAAIPGGARAVLAHAPEESPPRAVAPAPGESAPRAAPQEPGENAPEGVQGPRADTVLSVCSSCHTGIDAGQAEALEHADGVTCLTCHHVGFTSDPREAAARRMDVCVSCHEDLRPTHAGIEEDAPTCASCHTIHEDPPLPEAASAISSGCATCHETPHRLHGGASGADAQTADTPGAAAAGGAPGSGPAGQGPACADCHTLHGDVPLHEGDPGVVAACASCHEAPHPSHADAPPEEAPSCTTCHGLAPEDPPIPSEAAVAGTCASCHEDVRPAHVAVEEDAPACVDCHDFADDPPVEEAGRAVAGRCATCHEEAMADVRAGGHAEGMAPDDPNEDLPTCVTCHEGHPERGAEPGYTRLAATVQCVACHSQEGLIERYQLPENVARSYTEDFHGATVEFLWAHPEGEAQPPVMVCADCHGGHSVGWNEGSQVAGVCLDCHERGSEQLASAWLGHGRISTGNQPLIWLIRLFYYVLIPFVLGGLALQIWFHLRDQRRKGARMFRAEGVRRLLARLRGRDVPEPRQVTRFSLADRWEHLGSMISFVMLVVTGLPQTRPDLGAAQAVIGLFGGIATTRFVHRVMGFVFVGLLVVHVGRAVVAALRKRRLPVMTPTTQDFRDALDTLKHFIWGTPRPKVGKFDFSQKFEYWGLFLGGTLMSVTGVVLVFPELVTQVLPGVIVAAVRTMHGLEATFAVLVVALWHSYGVILRPEIFPLDTSIFTGKVSVERLKHEHALEYERLFPAEAAAEAAGAGAGAGGGGGPAGGGGRNGGGAAGDAESGELHRDGVPPPHELSRT